MDYKVLLFYKYTNIEHPELVREWQRALCAQYGILGRILISREGINGTIAGSVKQIRAYKTSMKQVPQFTDIQYKADKSQSLPFKKLIVKTRPEVVTLGVSADPKQGAPKLSPAQFHEVVEHEDVVIFDARNNYESAIGKFKNAITPDINLFKELPKALDKYATLKDKKIITVCTGGIRCEKASALMMQMGFKDVYQLDGGIINYAHKYPNGHWEGECYVFDERLKVAFNDSPELLGVCVHCGTSTNDYINCHNALCNKQTLMCAKCIEAQDATCSSKCRRIVKQTNIITQPI